MKTLYEMFNDLHASPAPAPSEVRRQPVCLLLGGGMAAGKSTVREIIGNDSFWSKVRAHGFVAGHDTYMSSATHVCRCFGAICVAVCPA